MRRLLALAAIALVAAPAPAQMLTGPGLSMLDVDRKVAEALAKLPAPATPTPVDTSGFASKVDLATVKALIPVPANAPPALATPTGGAGAAATYARGDFSAIRLDRAGTAVTNTAGMWSIQWAVPLLMDSTYSPVARNATNQPIVCNVATSTLSGATGRCWLARTLPAALLSLTALLSYDLFGAPAVGIQVEITTTPKSQTTVSPAP